ncbi:MAG: EFR1 family ferrodoxin [Chloroflexi bacterium]|nr:EFR1 family ferrodoxin [Chloroflexota bacterium]MBU1747709.1 EFR1 family ferrodoxin [Chloroflexota bacterium]
MDTNVVIYYFSGTGNAKRLTTMAADRLHAGGHAVEVRSIEEPGLSPCHDQASWHGFAFPVYCFGVPRIMRRFLENLPPVTDKRAFLLVSTGCEVEGIPMPPTEGRCLPIGRGILADKGYAVVGGTSAPMPNTWIMAVNAPTPEQTTQVVARAECHVQAFIDQVMAGQELWKPTSRIWGPMERLLNPLFQSRGLSRLPRLMRVDGTCTGCGICAQVCPTGNITLVDGRPTWSDRCEQCMRCFQFCPQEAVQSTFIGRTEGRRRYHDPGLTVRELTR